MLNINYIFIPLEMLELQAWNTNRIIGYIKHLKFSTNNEFSGPICFYSNRSYRDWLMSMRQTHGQLGTYYSQLRNVSKIFHILSFSHNIFTTNSNQCYFKSTENKSVFASVGSVNWDWIETEPNWLKKLNINEKFFRELNRN
jgi:hypothetical protein